MRGTINNVTVSLTPIGWCVSFACEIEHEAPTNIRPAVGIDRGVANSIALSNGELASVPVERLRLLDRRARKTQEGAQDAGGRARRRRARKTQKVLARRKRGSKRYAKARLRAAAIKAKAARIRKDWNHKATTGLVARFGLVAIEDLKTSSMTASAKGTGEEPGRNVRQKSRP
ncbi:transposase [Bradyrhizobium arachidis]|uniref:transposase n=1 Tax=Bradyrhizobium arachidis TaxID=858423 RepID=UPI0021611B28|nr:transposase [Bradyrhizobium arachidis]UVO30544.1 transposase [Bradyrhizobium arachidis]